MACQAWSLMYKYGNGHVSEKFVACWETNVLHSTPNTPINQILQPIKTEFSNYCAVMVRSHDFLVWDYHAF